MNRFAALAMTLALLVPASLRGQAVWDAPTFLRPGAPAGLTLALTDSNPGDGLGFLGLWRASRAPVGLGFRAGIAEGPGNDAVGILGVDISGSLSGVTGNSSAEAMWWTGAGVGLGNDVSASFPLGVVFAWTGQDEGVSFMPYAGGHMVLDVVSGPGDDLNLDGAVDLGLDLGFRTGWIARFSASVGGRDALGIGFRVPSGR